MSQILDVGNMNWMRHSLRRIPLPSVMVVLFLASVLPATALAQTPGDGSLELTPPSLEQPAQPQPNSVGPSEASETQWEGQSAAAVEVQGNRRVEADTILDRVDLRAGDTIEAARISDDIHRLYDLGYFDDIRVEAARRDDEWVIIFVVEEKPAVDKIDFVGAESLDDEDIDEAVTLERFAILDMGQVSASAEAIRDLYHDEGYFLADVDFEVTTDEDRPDLATVTFVIKEYAQVQVKRVTLLGNEAIEDDELQQIMATREGNILSLFTEMGTFKEDDFEEDLQRLTAYYYDQGYVQVQVDMPTIRLSDDKRDLYITVRIDEGPRHSRGEVGVEGDLLTERDELMEMLRLPDETYFRYGALQEDMMRLSRFYQDAGYANVQVNPLTRIDPETNQVDVSFDINQGQKVRIGRIEVRGNTTTRDLVIRRQLVIEEGDWYSASAIERSQARVERLGYFEEVNATTQRTSSAEVVDVHIEVGERPTGTFQLGAGLSSQESFIFQGQVSQENLFGRGQALQLSVQHSAIRTLFNLRFSEPWLLGTRWQLSTDLYNFDYLYQDFERRSTGGSLTVGYPIGELFGLPVGDALSASMRYKLENVDVAPGGITGSQAPPTSPLFEGGLTSSLRLGTNYDTRDNQLFPTEGAYHSASVEVADGSYTLSQNEFIKLDTDLRGYFPVIWNFVLRLNASAGYVANLSQDRPLPIFERYFVGGPETVRGFERFTLGPSQRVPATRGDPSGRLEEFHQGGNKQLYLTAELEFPIFAAAQLRGVFFADAGNAFGEDQPFTLRPDLLADDGEAYADALRTAVGLGVRWFSPIGPLRFEWGFPLQRLPGERNMVFDFSITNAF